MNVKLLSLALDPRDAEAMHELWSACQIDPNLQAEYGGFFWIELDSEAAKVLKDHWRQEQEWKNPKLLTPPPTELVEKDLLTVESGDMTSWLQLTLHLTLEPTSTHVALQVSDLRDTPGWKAADSATRTRIVDAAVRYLCEGDPRNDEWFRTTSIPHAPIAGFQALSLLMLTEDARLKTLSNDVWAKWVPTLLRVPSGIRAEAQQQLRLLGQAHELLPQETTKRILEIIDGANERNGHLFVSEEIDSCWDARLAEGLVEKARSPVLEPQILRTILEFLLQRDVPGGRALTESLIDARLSGSDVEKRQAAAAAQVLLRCTPDAGWQKIWPIMKEKRPIGRDIIESVSYGHAGGTHFITKLNEAQLGELYLWMVEAYPITERRPRSGAIGSGDTAVMLRDSVLEQLKNRGTIAACDAIRGIMEELPQYGWMQLHLEEAESLARANTWRPVSVREFLSLAIERDKRFVDSGSRLVEAVVESLDRLQAKLREELPAARDLWNTPNGKFSPRDEQEVADYVVRHLREDLRNRRIIVNREVQISRGIGDGTGQRTDIHVDSAALEEPGSYDWIYAIAEVKGNWHAELLTAMETQLRDRYLKEKRCRNGLYLVAWFTCPKWRPDDSRRNHCSQMSLAEAREFFSHQAVELSTDGYCIRSYVLDVSLS